MSLINLKTLFNVVVMSFDKISNEERVVGKVYNYSNTASDGKVYKQTDANRSMPMIHNYMSPFLHRYALLFCFKRRKCLAFLLSAV